MAGPLQAVANNQVALVSNEAASGATIYSLPLDLIEKIFLLLGQRDLVSAATTCSRTYMVMPRILARFASEAPLEHFLTALIAHNRFDKVLPPHSAFAQSNPATVSILLDSSLKAEVLKKMLACIPRFRTLRLHATSGEEAKEALSQMATTFKETPSTLRRFILSGTVEVQTFETILQHCVALQELDICDVRFTSTAAASAALVVPNGGDSHLPCLALKELVRLRLNPEHYSLRGSQLFKEIFSNCPKLESIDFRFFVTDFDGQVLHKPIDVGTLRRREPLEMGVLRLLALYADHVENHQKWAKVARQINNQSVKEAIVQLLEKDLKLDDIAKLVVPRPVPVSLPFHPIQHIELLAPPQNGWDSFWQEARRWIPFI